MQPVKFRVWDSKLNQMIYDDFVSIVLGHETGYAQELLATNKPMLFIGTIDIHDKEIYEGDIILRTFQSRFSRELQTETVDLINYYKFWGYEENEGWCDITEEIIGNIYENPELVP